MKTNKVGKIYNLSRSLYLRKIPLIPKLLWIINRIIFSCDIPYTANIHSTVTFQHNGLNTVIHNKSRIGANTVVLHNVTIGGNMGKKHGTKMKKSLFLSSEKMFLLELVL